MMAGIFCNVIRPYPAGHNDPDGCGCRLQKLTPFKLEFHLGTIR
jgi:hypothetical protein